ncbi:MAG TPA: glutamyl-tRNA reductase [Candidatus Latescibacteria bacterium]|jgi:glutamyl-tRNA reductase|nr:glutamyl-tRNA reductase [Gemmatimonadaceae bacterium]MDP6015281.1 glutamyl-tRNA reductase [Candidatus Latescibacterota bacterium]HJP31675.1 glutamyl-tRNA reductase [Candidatus Latescibacterota bacterium]
MHLLTLGLNHTTAPVEVRERLAFAEGDQPDSLRQLREGYGLSEVAILSTCNRSEIYAASDGPHLAPVHRYLAEQRRLDVADLSPCFYEYVDAEAATHLFRVSSGIDSLVIGESQILKQVREALETSQATGSARLVINEVFQRALRVGKRARSETDIGRGHLSVSTAAVELASQIFDSLDNRSALLLGAGEMIELTAQYLVDTGLTHFIVANRTVERAAELAGRFDGEAIPLDAIGDRLLEVDIVIASTAAPGFIVDAQMLRQAMSQRRGRPLFLIDIAVPRDIDPDVRGLDNVFLFDIDDLEGVVASNRQDREGEIRRVQDIVDEELVNFLHWFNSLSAGPLIRALREQAADLQTTELERWMGKLGHLTEEDRRLVEQVLRGYANKLLHQPLVQIRELANRDDGYLRLDTIRSLFDLDVAPEKDEESTS